MPKRTERPLSHQRAERSRHSHEEASSRTETIKDTVRRRDVEVEKSPGSTSGTSRKGSATRKT